MPERILKWPFSADGLLGCASAVSSSRSRRHLLVGLESLAKLLFSPPPMFFGFAFRSALFFPKLVGEG
jgi:hypothetical protein